MSRRKPTARQVEVLQTIFRVQCDGRCDRYERAGQLLGLSRASVHQTLEDLFLKLGVYGSVEAAYQLWLRELWGDPASS